MGRNIEPRAVHIHKSDTVSGAYFRDFLQKYQAYDAKQKQTIKSLQKRIDGLNAELSWYKVEIPEEEDEKARKIRNLCRHLGYVCNRNVELKQRIAELEAKINNFSNSNLNLN